MCKHCTHLVPLYLSAGTWNCGLLAPLLGYSADPLENILLLLWALSLYRTRWIIYLQIILWLFWNIRHCAHFPQMTWDCCICDLVQCLINEMKFLVVCSIGMVRGRETQNWCTAPLLGHWRRTWYIIKHIYIVLIRLLLANFGQFKVLNVAVEFYHTLSIDCYWLSKYEI